MGNRGILHGDHQQIERWAKGKLWIICQLAFGDRRRPLMTPGTYTELFFLDEPTAFAAGHRPCGECRRDDYRQFNRLATPGNETIPAGELDRLLDGERRRTAHRVVEYDRCSNVPAGSMVDIGGQPHLVQNDGVRSWSFRGYGLLTPWPDRPVPVLTPPTTRRAMAHGYDAQAHSTAAL